MTRFSYQKDKQGYHKKNMCCISCQEKKDMESEGVSRSTTEQELLGREICFIW